MAYLNAHRLQTTVLVVDDSPEMQRYLRTLLELDSYRVVTASNGYEALLLLRLGCAPAAVLLDLQMPGMDGLETLRRLQELRPASKVILCTGVEDPEKIREATALGAQAYLLKPIQHLYLSAAVERCLQQHSGTQPAQRPRARLFVLPSPSLP
jgi:CheY-like chemotaxis protein